MELMETFHIITTRQSFLSKFKFSIDPRGDLARKTMCFICLSGKISKQTEKAAFSSNQMFNVNDSLMNGTKRVRINSAYIFSLKMAQQQEYSAWAGKTTFLYIKNSVSHESLVVAFERSINDTCI